MVSSQGEMVRWLVLTAMAVLLMCCSSESERVACVQSCMLHVVVPVPTSASGSGAVPALTQWSRAQIGTWFLHA